MSTKARIAVVIPTYRSRDQIMGVLNDIPEGVEAVYVVDDGCPDRTGHWAVNETDDPRVQLIALAENQGVGGATLAGFDQAFADGHDVAVKVDSDGQLDPALVPDIAEPLLESNAGYAKGSRFTTPKNLVGMPRHRVFLNAVLSITNKFASGYYSLSDPTNGLIGLHRDAYALLDTKPISRRFFFESDLMHHLNLARVPAVQVPMAATYADEESNLSFRSEALPFMWGTTRNFFKRIFMRHFVLSFSLAGIYLTVGMLFSLFSLGFGLATWIRSATTEVPSNSGAVAIVLLSALVGINFISTFFVFDVNDEPS